MTEQATGTFENKSWDENPYAEIEGGAKLTRASVTQSVTGDITGEAATESLMYYGEDGTATFVELKRVVGRIGDRSGSFILQSTGKYDGNEAKSKLLVIPGSGTDDLIGLRGEGSFVAPHGPTARFTLDYGFD